MSSVADSVTLPCGITLPNRFVKAAMAEQMAKSSNLPDENFKRVYKDWAKGGWGLVITGNVQTNPGHLGQPGDLSVDAKRLSDPNYLKAWKEWAQAAQADGAHAAVQINHPGRQSPIGAGNRGIFAKTIAPSAVPLDFGPGLFQRFLRAAIFGTPRALSTEEVGDIINQYVTAAKLCYDSGFDGVQIHGAHGYLLAQFLSKKSNIRTDEFGGSAFKRAEIIVRIIHAVRAATSPSFIIGLKLNSVDASQSGGNNDDFIEQVKRFEEAGIDFLEISGGSYEDPAFIQHNPDEKVKAPVKSAHTAAREAFFLTFATSIRSSFPSLPLVVTGGFRTLAAMNEAISTKQCDFIGLGRPACLSPYAATELLGVKEGPLDAPKIGLNWLMKLVPVRALGAGHESNWYATKIRALGL